MKQMRTLTILTAVAVSAGAVAAQTRGITFTDVTQAAGINFTHNSGRTGKKYLPETLGSGAAFFDADGDGWPDIFLMNGQDWTPRQAASR